MPTMLHRYRQRHTRSLGDLFISLWNRVDSIRGHRSHVSTSHTKPIHFTKTNLLLLCGNMNDSLFVCPAPLWMRTAMRWCVDEICTGYLYISFQCFPLIFFFRRLSMSTTDYVIAHRPKYCEAMENYESHEAHRRSAHYSHSQQKF